MQSAILVISILGLIYCGYHALVIVWGSLKKLPDIAECAPQKRLAVVIPARNEERVIRYLISSLKSQRYPKELYDIYVVPNNCTDRTEEVSRQVGARIFYCQNAVRSKGDVLHEVFESLLKAPEGYDGFIVFDADNIVDGGFLQAANDALCAGYQVGQAYRDSKNPDDSWISGCTSVFFWFMNGWFNRPRAALGLSSSLNGTGILIGAKMLRKNGYNTSALTEDLEFTAQCALAGEKIAWMPNAITYDEQPIKFRDSWIQRRRWSAGTRQCLLKYAMELYRKARTNCVCLDVGLHFTGALVQILSFIPGILTALLLLKGILEDPVRGWTAAAWTVGTAALFCFLGGAAMVLITCLKEHKFTKKRLREMVMMGPYLFTWMLANFTGILFPSPGWKEIPHVIEKDISQCSN